MSYTKPDSSGRRVSWALAALDANRQGSTEKLKEAFSSQRKGSDVNAGTVNGAYGGYRFPTWTPSYAGNKQGETLLHLAVREDNECYPNRYEFCKCLVQDLKIDTSIINEDEFPARKLTGKGQMIIDAVHPLKQWTNADCVVWLEGLGEWTKKNRQWSTLFTEKQVTGDLLITFLEEENTKAFSVWLEGKSHDLAFREVYSGERKYIAQGLKVLLKEFKIANAFRRKMEKPIILAKRKLRRAEERKERLELVLMANEESSQVNDAEYDAEMRQNDAEADEAASTEIEGVNKEISNIEREVEQKSREIEVVTGRMNAPKNEAAEKKKSKQEKQNDEERAEADQKSMLDLNTKLTELSRNKSSLQLKLEELKDAGDIRTKRRERYDLAEKIRGIDLDRVNSTIEIENIEVS